MTVQELYEQLAAMTQEEREETEVWIEESLEPALMAKRVERSPWRPSIKATLWIK